MADWIKDTLESIMWNIVGNLMPLYVMIFIAVSEHGVDFSYIYEALHQPFTLLILSGTYITNSYYTISKSRLRNRIFPFIFGLSLLFIGLLIKDKSSLENLSASFFKELIVLIMFIASFFLYIFYEFWTHYKIYHPDQDNEAENQFNNLENQFDELQ